MPFTITQIYSECKPLLVYIVAASSHVPRCEAGVIVYAAIQGFDELCDREDLLSAYLPVLDEVVGYWASYKYYLVQIFSLLSTHHISHNGALYEQHPGRPLRLLFTHEILLNQRSHPWRTRSGPRSPSVLAHTLHPIELDPILHQLFLALHRLALEQIVSIPVDHPV